MSRSNSVSYLLGPRASTSSAPYSSGLGAYPRASQLRLWLDHPYFQDIWPNDGLMIHRLPFVVGRKPDEEGAPRSHVDLLLPDKRPYQLSRVHFCVLNYDGSLAVMDTNSQLGTFVNGVGIGRGTGRNHAFLSSGENRITLGSNSRFVFTLKAI